MNILNSKPSVTVKFGKKKISGLGYSKGTRKKLQL